MRFWVVIASVFVVRVVSPPVVAVVSVGLCFYPSLCLVTVDVGLKGGRRIGRSGRRSVTSRGERSVRMIWRS